MPPDAADGDSQITAVVGHVAGQPAFDEDTDILIHFLRQRRALQKLDHRRIASGKRAQQRVIVRVGQAAHVVHQVGIQRHTMLETKGFEQQGKARTIYTDEVLDPRPQRHSHPGRWCRCGDRSR